MLKRFFAKALTPAAPVAAAPQWRGGGDAAVLSVSTGGEILAASENAAQIFGEPSGLDGLTLQGLCAFSDRAAVDAMLRDEGAARVETLGASPRQIAMRCQPAAEGVVTVLAIDRSAQAAAETRLRAEATAASELLADLSHEMKTPLNAVIGFADAMRGETFGPLGHEKYGEYADHIAASGAHLVDLISTILDLAKSQSGRAPIRRSVVRVEEIAGECLAMVRQSAEEAGLDLTADIAPDLPESYLDGRAIRQILLNLLSNAIKFTSQGRVSLHLERSGDMLVARIADTGVGMSAEELKRIGARFTSVHKNGVRGAGGAGLGLALAFVLAEAQGGALKLESAPGEGVTATLRLPIAAAPAREADDADASDEPIVHSQLDRIEALRRELNERKAREGQRAA